MKEKIFTNLQYVVLVSVIVGQCVVGVNFFVGQAIYLIANTIAVIRCFVLNRPTPDKIKDCSCLGITAGLILFKIFC